MIRRPLPSRRDAETIRFNCDKFRYYGSFSRFEDGSLAEIFLAAGKAGSHIEAQARDMAVAASLALQFGCPAHVLRAALTRLEDDKAAGPLAVLLDIIAKDDPDPDGKVAA